MFLLLMAGVLTLFTVRDAVVHGLARAGYPVARDRVMIHLYAALMALLAYVIGFSDPGGHGYDIRWYMLFILPLMVYLFNFMHDRTMRLIGRLFERR